MKSQVKPAPPPEAVTVALSLSICPETFWHISFFKKTLNMGIYFLSSFSFSCY